MTELVAVRHGQASFGAADYDALSELGHRQSRALAEWLVGHGEFAAVYRGAMRRHRETLEPIAAAYAAAGRPLPEATVLPGLDEFDHRNVLEVFRRLHPAHEAVEALDADPKDLRAVYRFLRAGLSHWCEGGLDEAVDEPWHRFRARVGAAAEALAEASRRHGGRILAVTSGGVMAQLAQHALDLGDAQAVELNLSIRNSALSEFRLVDRGWTLASWNALPHLPGVEHRAMWTYY